MHLRRLRNAFLILVISFTIFVVTGYQNHTRSHFFVPLAQAFLHGRLYVDRMEYELHEMVSEEEVRTGVFSEFTDGASGTYYVIYPPLPAVLLMPAVSIWGAATNQSHFSILLASISVAVAYLVFEELTRCPVKSTWLAVLYGLGSMLWYHAIIGSAWYYSQVCGLLFLWLAILATLRKKPMMLIGVLIGLAYLSRYPLLLTFPFFVWLTKDRWWVNRRVVWMQLLMLVGSFGALVSISLLYNYVRYGQFGHYGYTLLEKRTYNIQNEYRHGSYSLAYTPRVLRAMFWTFPTKVDHFPFLIPNRWAMSLWLVFPAIFIAVTAPWKNRLVQASILAIICILPTALFHGGVGATQFGFRYALDYMPFLLIVIAMAVKERLYLWQKGLIGLCVLINMWGIWF